MGFRKAPVKPTEALRLRRKGIESDEDLWYAIGQDFDSGIENLAARTRIPRDRLIEILAVCAVREPDPGGAGSRRRAARHTLDIAALGAILLLIALGARARGCLSALPAPWGLRERVPVTAYQLPKERVLRRGHLVEVWGNPRPDQFRDPSQVEGLRLARDIQAGSVLRYQDVLREQVVALRDLPQGGDVPLDAVARRWSAYDPDALLDIQQAAGWRVIRSIRKDEVISLLDLEAGSERSARRRP